MSFRFQKTKRQRDSRFAPSVSRAHNRPFVSECSASDAYLRTSLTERSYLSRVKILGIYFEVLLLSNVLFRSFQDCFSSTRSIGCRFSWGPVDRPAMGPDASARQTNKTSQTSVDDGLLDASSLIQFFHKRALMSLDGNFGWASIIEVQWGLRRAVNRMPFPFWL